MDSSCSENNVHATDEGLLRLFRELTHCRECGRLTSPFEKTCPGCGASSPVVVSVGSFLLPVAVCLVALIVVILVL